jgi:hypothetical protein
VISTLQDNPVNYTLFLIEDFAVVKGVDLSFTKRTSDYLSGTLTYSFLDAKGSGSSAREYYYLFRDTETPLPKREYPLEFDITHAFKANLNFYVPRDFGPRVLGMNLLGDINANMQFQIATGAPFTPTDTRGNPLEVGSRRMPSTQTTNLRIDKFFSAGKFDVGFFIDVRNLFDKVNVVDVYDRTGKPDDDGYAPLRESYRTVEEYLAATENWKAFVKDPDHYGGPRRILIGATFDF